jgi:hypothetical protein
VLYKKELGGISVGRRIIKINVHTFLLLFLNIWYPIT